MNDPHICVVAIFRFCLIIAYKVHGQQNSYILHLVRYFVWDTISDTKFTEYSHWFG